MTNAISGTPPGQFVYQPQQAAVAKPAPQGTAAPARDTVTISSQGKQAAQLLPDGDSPAQEAMESPGEKASETLVGRN